MEDTLTITDNRTGKTYDIPIMYGTYKKYGAAIRATDLRQIKFDNEDFGMLSYDPGFGNTASCKSAVTFIDGERGILHYRGYQIDELARKSNFMEVAYLTLHGELPTKAQMEEWTHNITHHTMVHEHMKKFMDGFHHDAHPMGILVSTVAALSTFYPDAKNVRDPETRKQEIYRLVAKMPTISAYAYRHSMGLPYVHPDNELSYAGNFLNMLFKMAEPRYEPNEILEHALDVLFILHVDHEQNCSANTMRSVGSSLPDPYVAVASAAAALYGPLHGGANERVLRMLREIGSIEKVPDYVKRAKAGEFRLMGFGHRVYKNYDPRARILREMAPKVFEVTGKNPLLDIAIELERIALEDDYFVERKLYPNVDFYSGIIYQAMGFPVDMFPVLFAIPRTVGWLAQWQEMLDDSDQRIARPRQVFNGYDIRDYIPVAKR
ncbi:citrate synthase [candidate division KSB1 bacterium]|nr:citrate synthase [candidate division KSB1 bacterium]NIR71213.1 citrate synthase [candidate division KSB1 bacterium]NIS23317.1 citrate synthase [candidate division KSB1 bacterium]NIT70196.1 citrate synthase [candidate division KSB1 bacterium]NIU23848.1 citrate synthase [candidate division KSB1 bacterium]